MHRVSKGSPSLGPGKQENNFSITAVKITNPREIARHDEGMRQSGSGHSKKKSSPEKIEFHIGLDRELRIQCGIEESDVKILSKYCSEVFPIFETAFKYQIGGNFSC